MTTNKKPHIQKVKEDILKLVEDRITSLVANNAATETATGETDYEMRRTIAIWIKQRNRLAKDVGAPLHDLKTKTLQGSLIYLD